MTDRRRKTRVTDLKYELERHLIERKVGWDRTTVALIIEAFHGDTESFVRHHIRMLSKLELSLAKNALAAEEAR